MPTFKLDDREIPFEKGDTILRAAYRVGIGVPHYCWHPGLSVAANCRMCLVEIEPPPGGRPMLLDILRWDAAKNDWVPDRKPKLQPGCQIAVTDGMVVRSETSKHVAEARSHVQEFLLLNHPVDCPICDQAGECKLQDYWMSDDRQPKRLRDEPVHKPKAVQFGPKIVYDAERCIACTRCIRVCDEVVGDHVLDLRERGNRNEITLAPGRTLDGDYALMTEHVCPVGALTSSHFRFKARVWTLHESPSVCPGCSTGCNAWLDADTREQRVYRARPRDNEAVNQYWMCDDGMMTYTRVQEKRVLRPRTGREGDRTEATYDTAIAKATEGLKSLPRASLAVVLSAQSSTEDNLALADLARALGATMYLSAKPPWRADKILRSADQNPNRAGAKAVAGGSVKSLGDLVAEVSAGHVQAVVALGTDADVDADTLAPLARVGTVVLLASNDGPLARFATVILPVCTWAESDGSFTNGKGRAQTFRRALLPRGESIPAWEAVGRLATALGADVPRRKLKDLRAVLSERYPIVAPPTPGTGASPAGTSAAAGDAGTGA